MVDRLLGRPQQEAEQPPVDPAAAAWSFVQRARDQKRPHTLELLHVMADEFVELHGDRLFGDDEAIVAGFARIAGRRLAVIGFQKGQDTDENIRRNFGLPHAEGYRKGIRVMQLAERFGLPVVTFVDVQGAFPGAAAEERGVAEAIASSIGLMTRLRTPIVAVITGEGGSGGALALAVADVVLALENTYYSVITPEGCAAILWRSADHAAQAALALKVSAPEQQELGVVDAIIPEPPGGAQTDPAETARHIRDAIMRELEALERLAVDDLVDARFARFRAFGSFKVASPAAPPPERPGITDRLRGLLNTRPSLPALPTNRRDEPPGREEV